MRPIGCRVRGASVPQCGIWRLPLRWGAWLTSVATLVLPAWADGVPRHVHLVLPACEPEPFAYDELLEALRLELGQAGVAQVSLGAPSTLATGEALARLSFPCDPDAPAAQLTLRSRGGETTYALDLSDLPPEVRPRGIALAVAELTPSAWPALLGTAEPKSDVARREPEPETVGSKQAEPEESEAVVRHEQDARREERRARASRPPEGPDARAARLSAHDEETSRSAPAQPIALGVSGQLRVYALGGTALWGARVTASWGRFDVGLDAMFGRHPDDIGRLESRLLAASLALRAVDGKHGSWRYWFAPRASLGTIATTATPTEASHTGVDVKELYLDGAVPVGTGFVSGRCQLSVELEGGYARGYVATFEGDTLASFGGLLASARLGAGCRLR